MAKAGRPSSYSDALAETILERLSQGESLVQVCVDDAMPGLRTVMRWAAENPDFGTEYARAREAQAEVMDDKILDAAKDAKSDPQAARVQIEAYKWRAAKLAPKRYGDKIDVTTGGEAIRAMDDTEKLTRIASILAAAQGRGAGDE